MQSVQRFLPEDGLGITLHLERLYWLLRDASLFWLLALSAVLMIVTRRIPLPPKQRPALLFFTLITVGMLIAGGPVYARYWLTTLPFLAAWTYCGLRFPDGGLGHFGTKPDADEDLLTGATGYIGCRLPPDLLQKDYQVRILVRDKPKNVRVPISPIRISEPGPCDGQGGRRELTKATFHVQVALCFA